MEIFDLLLYCVQQLGIMLGVGGEAVLLIGYLLSIRDGLVDAEDLRFAAAVKHILEVGLFFIIISGLGITALHYSEGQAAIVFEPTYLFKWMLIALIVCISIVDRSRKEASPLLIGVSGGAWSGLFIVHILAFIATWMSLGVVWALWMVAFIAIWMGLVRLIGGKKAASPLTATSKPAKETVPPAPRKPSYSPSPKPEPVKDPMPEPPHNLPVLERQKVLALPAIPLPAPVVAVVSEHEPVEHELVFTNLATTEAFPYKETALTNTPMLHPHLTNEREESNLPTPPAPSKPLSGLQLKDAEVTAHLSAVRIMPRKPEDLEIPHHNSPLVKYG